MSEPESKQKSGDMEFKFKLRPVSEIHSWGGGERSPYLSWFGLTDGWFWIEVGGQELFRYSDDVLAYWQRAYPESSPSRLPYQDYYVVRSWEDLIEMLPTILDPLPDDLAALVANESNWQEWEKRAQNWNEDNKAELASDIYYQALALWWNRRWNASHLNFAPDLLLWRDDQGVNIRWRNCDMAADGIPVWVATHGEITIPVDEFLTAVDSFNTRFIGEMAERVDEVVANGGISGVEIDLDMLVREQTDRSTWLKAAINPWAAEVRRDFSWDEIREAMAVVSASFGNHSA